MEQTRSRAKRLSRRFEALGTLNELTIFETDDRAPDAAKPDATERNAVRLDATGPEAAKLDAAELDAAILDAAERRVREIDAHMSVFRPESDIARLNACAGRKAAPLHPETLRLLELAKDFAARSGGAFDVTVRPLTALWGIGRNGEHIPSEQEIARARRLADSRALVCDARSGRAFLKRKGQAVDLGGIAKGYAADEVRRILLESGVKSALINLGGNIAALGVRPDGQPWRIGVQHPAAPRGAYLGVLDLCDDSAVTSGSNERFFIRDGVRFHHLLDPRTGRPAQSGLLSVTVVCASSAAADALSTALFVLGGRGAPLLREYGAEAVFATEQGGIFATEGLRGRFAALSSNADQKEAHHA